MLLGRTEKAQGGLVGKSIMLRGLAALLLVVPLFAQGAGLGPLRVLSALGQPLNAEIDIVSLRPGEDDGLSAKLGSEQAFRRAGIAYNPGLSSLRFAVVRAGGKAVIRLTSHQPVNEPFLEMLVELQWATGRLVREYTFLLDPPEYKAPMVSAAPAPAPARVMAAQPAPAAAVPVPAARRAAAPMAAAGKSATDQLVKKGDTLSKIARQHLSGGVTLNQMMMALYRANREAFINNNINLVRAGRILRVPDRDAAAAIDTAEATREVLAQMRDFGAYRRALAAAAPAAPGSSAQREVSGRIVPKAADAAPSADKDKLKLSRADARKPGAAVSRAARDDDRAARERALKESESRITDLEKNVSDLQKLLEIKNQQVAELEKRASSTPATVAPAKAAAAAPMKAAAPAAKAAPAAPAAAKPEPAKPVAATPEAMKPAAAKPEAMKPEMAAKPAPEKPAPPAATPAAKPAAPAAKVAAAKPKPRPAPPPPPPAPSLVDEFLENPVALGGLVAVLVLLGGYGTWAWRRKKAGQSRMQGSLAGASTGGGAASVFNAPAAAAAEEEVPSVSDMAVSDTSVGSADADEVDPIAEADVYMAYGRDAQAEEILREALQKDAARPGVLAKLLEIYVGRRDAKSFEETARKLKGLVSDDSDVWAKAAAQGASIDPDNGLYSGAGAAPSAPAESAAVAAPSLDFDLDAAPGGDDTAAADLGLDAGAASQAEAPSVDFDLGGDNAPAVAAGSKPDSSADATMVLDLKAGAGDGGLDFDLGDATPAADTSDAAKPAADDGDSIDFDLNLDVGADAAPGREIDPDATVAVSSMDLSSISLDLDAPAGGSGESDPKWQEVATKLDLAKAYQEMGDKDGARELLNEVVKEGDADARRTGLSRGARSIRPRPRQRVSVAFSF